MAAGADDAASVRMLARPLASESELDPWLEVWEVRDERRFDEEE